MTVGTIPFWHKGIVNAAPLGNMVAYWKFDETSAGSTLIDSSGNGNSGSPQNNPTPSTTVPSSIGFTDTRSLSFNGSNQYANVASSTTTNFTAGFTISFWMNPTAWNNGSSAGIVSKKIDNQQNGYGYVIYDDGSSSCGTNGTTACGPLINMRLQGTTGTAYPYLSTASSVTANTWTQWTAVYNASTQNFSWYKNGSLDKSYSNINAGNMTNTLPLLIGQSQNWNGFYNGKLDDFRMYNVPLSTTQISALGSGTQPTATWTGVTSTDFNTASNWDIGSVPDTGTAVIVPATTNRVILAQNTTVGSMTIQTGGVVDLNGDTLTVSGSTKIANSGTIISKNTETGSSPIDPTIGTVLYTNTTNATGLALGNSYNNLVLNDGQIAYFKLDEATQGAQAVDSSGYGLNATPGGTTKPTPSTSVPSNISFTDSHSASFNGTTSYESVPDISYLDTTSAVSAAAWVKFNSVGSNQVIAGKWQSGSKEQWLLQLNSDNHIDFWTANGGTGSGTEDDVESSTTITTGTWYHIVATYSGASKYLYVNGVQVGHSTAATAMGNASATPLTIGATINSGSAYTSFLNGNLDDVRLYNFALSSIQAAALAAGQEPATSEATTTLSSALGVNGTLTLGSGTLDVSSSNYGVSVGGNFGNNGGVFIPRSGTVTLNGSGQSINASTNFYNLTKSITVPDTLTFGQGSTTGVAGTLSLTGTSGNILTLASSVPGTQWKLNPTSSTNLQYLSVTDSNDTGSEAVTTTSTDGGNNFNWDFSAPNTPTNLGSSDYLNGSYHIATQPSLSFSLSDSDANDTVKYQIQIATTSNFSSPIVDYSSGLATQGSTNFTIGQVAGSGSYTTGSSGQALTDGLYYWRVRSIDSGGLQSVYQVAGSGSVAFGVDTTAPSIPGTPSTTTPTANTNPSWSWTASTDSGSGLASPAYNVQWSQSSTFSSGVSSSTSSSTTFLQPTALTDGTWYFRVSATDSVGNVSSYSLNGSVLIDATAPTIPGVPTTTTPSASTHPVWSWAASTDTGSGLNQYIVQWSDVVSFATYSTSLATTNSYTLPIGLSDGPWYFRAEAVDAVGNVSAYSQVGSVLIDTTAPSIPGVPSTISPTNNAQPTWSWSASGDGANGSGFGPAAYTVQWSQSSTFSLGVNSSTTGSNSFSQPSGLSDGTWYFRVRTQDVVGNTSSWSTIGSVVVDTIAPSIPGTPSTTTPTANTTPTWSWSASTDAGTGLAASAYITQWSQSVSFTSGVTTMTTSATTFTQPTNLSSGTWYFRVKATDSVGNSSNYSSSGVVVIDTIPAVILNVSVTSPSISSEMITWVTDKLSSSQVTYGPSTAYVAQTAITDTNPRVTVHTVTLTNLVSCTTYHYQLSSIDTLDNQATSSNATFITSGCVGSSPVLSQTSTVAPASTGASLTLATTINSITVEAPANFTTTNTVLQIKQLDSSQAIAGISTPANYSSVQGSVYDVKALENAQTVITSFNQPVTITLGFTDDEISGLILSSLVIYRFDDGAGWQPLTNCQTDLVAHTITCSTTGFSTFALFGIKNPVTSTQTTSSVSSSSPAAATLSSAHHAASPPSLLSTAATSADAASSSLAVVPGVSLVAPAQVAVIQKTATDNVPSSANKARLVQLYSACGLIVIGLLVWLVLVRRRHHK